MDTPYPLLFAPFAAGRLQLRNRIVHASMTTRFAVDQRVTERLVQYYANRAAGGAALLVTEPLSVAPHQRLPHKVRAWNDDDLAGLRRWAAAVAAHDCRLIAQIQDPGRGRHEKGRNPDAIGPAAWADDLSWTVPRALAASEIVALIAHFAAAAARLERCGFAGVELSCGHGHLFHQFLSPLSNDRDDAYGGERDNRLKFVRDTIAAIRAACSPRFIVGLKLPGDDGVPGSIDPQEASEIAARLALPGAVDYVCFTWGAHARSLDMHSPDLTGPRAPFVPITAQLRRHCHGLPVMALGLITDPAEAEGILARGAADLIALGRPLVTDPAWPTKARHGRERDIRYCVSCNTCWATIVDNKPLACDNNPRVAAADEVDYWPQRAARRRRIVVVGGGVAGLEAAWVAAARGHRVTLFNASGEVGGAARLHAHLPGGQHLSSIYDYQWLAAQRAGVRFELGLTATVADVLAERPDHVVLATGADCRWPTSLPDELRADGALLDLRAAVALLSTHTGRIGGRAVIFDMDATEAVYASAVWMRAKFDEVIVATPRDRVAQDTPLVTQLRIWRQLNHLRIRIVPFCELSPRSRWEAAEVLLRNVYSGDELRIEEVSLVAYATPRVPRLGLVAGLDAAAVPYSRIGDCLAPRGVLAATADGHRAGHEV
ncbi:MAG: NAD(P)-binding protein [Steroidobacteraceae bacterium]|nr:NAD(P)-binding protein [Steroidobacteraceae bacterium]MDW8259261.1 NAD(P)-binding protein [Gammaproteobacteria bacterium]